MADVWYFVFGAFAVTIVGLLSVSVVTVVDLNRWAERARQEEKER